MLARAAALGPTPKSGVTTAVDDAARIMGKGNFHGVKALQVHLGVTLSNATKKKWFGTVPFSPEVLDMCKDTHVLVACAGISLMEVRKAQTSLFYTRNDPWWRKEQRVAQVPAEAGWHLVRKDPAPNSTKLNWIDQLSLLDGGVDEVPSASVLAQVILIHRLETYEILFDDYRVRVSDVGSGGGQITISQSGLFGLDVFGMSDDIYAPVLGVASSQYLS